MKVAIVYHFFPHYRAGVLRELLRNGANDYMFVGDDRCVEPTIRKWEVKDSAHFHLAPCRRIATFLFQRGLCKLGLSRDYDVVVYLGNPYFFSTWISALLARLTHKRVLFWTHGWTRNESGIKAAIRKLYYKLADALLLYGHTAKMTGIAKGFPMEKLHVIYNSLDYDAQKAACKSISPQRLAALRQKLFPMSAAPIVMCCARLTPQCRFDLLLHAQARLREEGHLVNVLLVGDGPEKLKLEKLADELKLPVSFYGACYDEVQLAALTMCAHATVSPGKVGLTAMQSLAFGTPVITHDDFEAQMPEWEAIIPGSTGDFFRRGDANDLARVIRAWTLNSKGDPARRTECLKLLERFYNPAFQRRALERAVRGLPADDLFWLREDGETS